MMHEEETSVRTMREFRQRYGCQHVWRKNINGVRACILCGKVAPHGIPWDATHVVEGRNYDPGKQDGKWLKP